MPFPLSAPLPNCKTTSQWWISWAQKVGEEALKKGYNIPRDYKLLSISVPSAAETECVKSAGSFGWQDGACKPIEDGICGLSIYKPHTTSARTIIHETLHNLGLRHANFASCPAGEFSYTGTCESLEYGDRYDPMGGGVGYTKMGLLNPVFAEKLGWAANTAQMPLETARQTFNLKPYSDSSGLRVLQIPVVENQPLGSSPGDLYISHRPNKGADRPLYASDFCPKSQGLANGLLLHLKLSSEDAGQGLFKNFYGSLGGNFPSYLIDAAPSWGKGYCGVSLRPGGSWQSPDGTLKIWFKSYSPLLNNSQVVVTRSAPLPANSQVTKSLS